MSFFPFKYKSSKDPNKNIQLLHLLKVEFEKDNYRRGTNLYRLDEFITKKIASHRNESAP